MTESGLTYRDAGVDIDAGDELVERIKPVVKRTMRKEVLAGIGGFGALVEVPLDRYRKPVLVSGTDGVGTKLRLAIDTGRHDKIGIDLVAMCANDIAVSGRRAAVLPRLLRHRQAARRRGRIGDPRHRRRLRAGRRRAGRWRDRRDARHVSRRRLRPRRLLRRRGRDATASSTARSTAAGDVVIGLASSGPHSNGYSLIRKLVVGRGRERRRPSSTASRCSTGCSRPRAST